MNVKRRKQRSDSIPHDLDTNTQQQKGRKPDNADSDQHHRGECRKDYRDVESNHQE
jgi:hypothetical protein